MVTFAVIGGWVLYAVANAEYFGPRDDLITKQAALDKQKQDDIALFAKQKALNKVWEGMLRNGLKNDPSIADTQLYEALETWSAGAGLDSAPDLRRDPDRKAGDKGTFDVISYTVKANGSTKAISKLFWALETATIPIRVANIAISAQPEGSDRLQAHLEVSTLCMPQADNSTTKPFPALAATRGSATQAVANTATTHPTISTGATK